MYVIMGVLMMVIVVECVKRLMCVGVCVVCVCVDVKVGEGVFECESEMMESTTRDEEGDVDGVKVMMCELLNEGEVVMLYCDLEKLEMIESFVKVFCVKAWVLDGILNVETATMVEFGFMSDGIE